MKAPGKIQITVWLLGLAGAALFTILLIRQGAPQIGAAFASAGWAIAAVVAYHFAVPVFLDSLAWWVLFPRSDRLPLRKLLWMRWIGESFSALVLALLVGVTGQKNFVRPTLVGTLIGVLGVLGFYFVQRLGMFRFLARVIARLANSPEWHSLVQGGETLDRTVRTLYARRHALVMCCVWTTISLVGGSGEIWIALYALDLHPTFVNALILQSMVLTIRSAAFAVPGGLGVQEGGYLFVGNLLGIPGDAAFALSLIARVRELALGIPGLISWQVIEARRLWRGRLAATAR